MRNINLLACSSDLGNDSIKGSFKLDKSLSLGLELFSDTLKIKTILLVFELEHVMVSFYVSIHDN